MMDAYEAAVATGAMYFNTGDVCKSGHLSDRYTRTKKCVQCHKVAMAATKEKYREREAKKVAERAAARAMERESLQPQREAARKTYLTQWRKDNKERSKAINDIWRSKNAEKMKSTTIAWRKEHPERVRMYSAEWAKRNPEKTKERRARRYSIASIEARKEERRRFHERNPGASRRYNSQYRARKMRNGGALSKDIVARLLKIQRGKCACCGLALGRDFHLDHIVPLTLGGPNVDANVQLLRQRCNNQKSNKHPIDFMRSRGFLL